MQFQKQFDKSLNYSKISDSKRQQTTAVDYKRLINGLVLAGFASLQHKSEMSMKQFEYVPEIQSELGAMTKMELRRYVLDYYKNYLKGKEIINNDTGITVHFSMTSGRKTAMGEAMYQKKPKWSGFCLNWWNMPSITTLENANRMKVRKLLDI